MRNVTVDVKDHLSVLCLTSDWITVCTSKKKEV
jgi:hypothetical protein